VFRRCPLISYQCRSPSFKTEVVLACYRRVGAVAAAVTEPFTARLRDRFCNLNDVVMASLCRFCELCKAAQRYHNIARVTESSFISVAIEPLARDAYSALPVFGTADVGVVSIQFVSGRQIPQNGSHVPPFIKYSVNWIYTFYGQHLIECL
jgi:hypothetical protein